MNFEALWFKYHGIVLTPQTSSVEHHALYPQLDTSTRKNQSHYTYIDALVYYRSVDTCQYQSTCTKTAMI